MCPINLIGLKERFDKKAAQRVDRFNMKDDDNYIRLLPPSLEYFSENVTYIAYDYLIHFNIAVGNTSTTEVCLKSTNKNNKCPICDKVFTLYKSNALEDKNIASTMRAKYRYLFNVIDLQDIDKGIQILEVGPSIYNEIVMFVTNPKYGDLLDINKGRNITITKIPAKNSASGYIEYNVIPDPEITSIRENLPENYKEQIALLVKNVPLSKTYIELKNVIEGTVLDKSMEDITCTQKGDIFVDFPDAKNTVQDVVNDRQYENVSSSVEDKKNCFGKEYGPSRDKCIECSMRNSCREKFLTI